jgi:hypothetical protein
MHFRNGLLCAGLIFVALQSDPAAAQQKPDQPLPDIRQLMREVQEHQKQLDNIRENYTYTSWQTTEDIDADGKVKKQETGEYEEFFVNGHLIERKIKRDGRQLDQGEQDKETERVTKLVEKAEKTPREKALDGPSISISRLLDIMDVQNPRRENFRGEPTIVFDFAGRKDVKTHGIAEDASKKLQGTIWINEADRQVAHLEVSFNDNFHIIGGILATVQKGSNFRFDQAKVNGEIWLPTGGEGTMQARVLMLKSLRQRFAERDYDYKRFSVETQQTKTASVKDQKPDSTKSSQAGALRAKE